MVELTLLLLCYSTVIRSAPVLFYSPSADPELIFIILFVSHEQNSYTLLFSV